MGTLTSPEFRIARRYIAFRIGGGDDEFSTCLHLLINGKIVKSATGWRSDHLVASSWDVSGYADFLEYSAAVYEEGYVKLGAVPFLDFTSMIKAAPALMRRAYEARSKD